MRMVLMNGEFIPREQAKVDIEDRGYQFGDGIYEVIRVYNGKMFMAKEHLERLSASSEKIGIAISYSISELTTLLEELIAKNSLSTGIIYMQFTRGVSPRNHSYPTEAVTPTFVAYTKMLNRPLDNLENGVSTITVEDIRWSRCDIKSLNLLGNVMAKQKATEADCYESIQYRELSVTEGSSSNIWIVNGEKIQTHEANQFILNGITRQKIIQLCGENGIEVEEKAFSIEDLIDADEVFLSSTTSEVTPIVSVNNVPVKEGKVGEMTKKLQNLFVEAIISECGQISN
ncbi:D-amino-acid transaminase [Niallia circulans]|jgi:D-alanine transaminase|uniref:D-alanine aminotransferase n=1 Tax=Niallia circulans TaxID=1397 RepID=A0A0J1I7I4_NIACI|nr:D-amino-acid transaminase [Niallia circulans]KLV21909.1 D-alanine aminotransferase [Niallia circulans]MCM2982839.1 D-amino-acid transaminase [Niallia circulans]MDR4317224.1 D-amino-acid transaminase [Niallia circulans]MED3838714.1 D-amino-acid transaminase [Niallia circulans]MED4245110.1 D-amino-acid transaminase [Niallia circulans]